MVADISVFVGAPAANPIVAGSMATDRPIRAAKMARPMRRIMVNFGTTDNRVFAAFYMYRRKGMVHALIFIKCYFRGLCGFGPKRQLWTGRINGRRNV